MEKEVLQDIGMTSNEADIYLILLKQSPISVNDLAMKASMHRQTVYDALDRLLDKGFATYEKRRNVKQFKARKPEAIERYLIEKQTKFKTIMPMLHQMQKQVPNEFVVEQFKARNIVRIVYRDIVRELSKQKSGREVVIFGTEEKKFISEDAVALSNQMKTFRKLGVKERILISEGDTTMVEGKQTKYRWMKKEYFSPVPIWVYADSVTIVSWGNPHNGLTIRNKEFADCYRKQFNMIWKISEEVKAKNVVKFR